MNSDQKLEQLATRCEEAAADGKRLQQMAKGMQDSDLEVKSSAHQSPDNSLFSEVKQDNCSLQSYQQNVGVISEANVADWLKYFGCYVPVV